MRVALLQPDYPVEGTEDAARGCIDWMISRLQALEPAAPDLVLLPEYATSPGLTTPAQVARVAARLGPGLVKACRATARARGCLVALGTAADEPCGLRNRALLIGPEGTDLMVYDKTHLPEVEAAGLAVAAGGMPSVACAGVVRVAFATCFDVYFPEFFAALAARDVGLILSPSYQRSESAARLRLISACRALDTGSWFARASYAMSTPGRGGHSLLAAPDGRIVADAGEQAGVCIAEFDPNERFVKPASHGCPEIEHHALMESGRRPALYRPRPERQAAVLGAPFPRICAHRGLSGACPENTLPAFGAAMAVPGVHELELDLWQSRDGVPVVCHDPRVDRTTDGQGLVAGMAWSEIRALDAGALHGDAWRGVRVPRLDEVLGLIDGRVGLNLHIKDPGPGGTLVHAVADMLRQTGMDRLGYIAGGEDVLEIASDYAPDIARCCLTPQGNPRELIKAALRHACTRLQFGRNVTAKDAAAAKEAGLVRNLFWSDDIEDACAYVALGIDVILTNRAQRLAGRL